MSGLLAVPDGGGLAPHPWDAIGKPPRPGHPYHVAAELEALIEPALAAARHLVEADYQREKALRYEDKADEHERDARPFLDKLPDKVAEAIRDNPDAFTTAEHVLREAAKAAEA